MTGESSDECRRIPIVIGSYSRMLRTSREESELPLFEWTVILHPASGIRGDLSPYIERVDFSLHKSFPDSHRKCLSPPFLVQAQGWGEFPIGVEIHVKGGGSVKAVHYLKLHGEPPIVANETFDYLILPERFPQVLRITNIHLGITLPLVDEYHSIESRNQLASIDEEFVRTNFPRMEALQSMTSDLFQRALAKDVELYEAQHKRERS